MGANHSPPRILKRKHVEKPKKWSEVAIHLCRGNTTFGKTKTEIQCNRDTPPSRKHLLASDCCWSSANPNRSTWQLHQSAFMKCQLL